LGRWREFREHKRGNQRIRKRVLTRHGRYSATRARRSNIQMRRVARKIHDKNVIWIVR